MVVKVSNDGSNLWNLYEMFNETLKIYKVHQILLQAIISNSARNTITFYSKDFSKSIPYVRAHEDIYLMSYRQTETTRRTTRKFLTNEVAQIINRR